MKQLTIYSTPSCSHCQQAKEYLTRLEIPFTDVNLHQDTQAMSFIRQQGHRSVPQIYLEDTQFVSGWPELRDMTAEQILQKING